MIRVQTPADGAAGVPAIGFPPFQRYKGGAGTSRRKPQRTMTMAPNPDRKRLRELNERHKALREATARARDEMQQIKAERDALRQKLSAETAEQ